MRAASREDLALVEAFLSGASAWLAARGIDQWQYPPRREKLLDSISRQECFLAFSGGRPVGTITVDGFADPEFWTDADEPSLALYVHRMAVSREAAGESIGARMLDWAAARAAAAGKSHLRLDAWKSNPDLQKYYRGQSFDLVRIVDLPHRQSGALFQRDVTGYRCGIV
jgi:GNAT superfamily N-acetyltransferase